MICNHFFIIKKLLVKKILLATVLLTAFNFCSNAQTDKKTQAKEILRNAIKVMDSGDPDRAILMLDTARKLDPENFIYDYETGFAYNIKKDYKKAIECFERCIKFSNANDQCYQMLGNAYDMDGRSEKAIAAYKEGLTKFPNSGKLYLEMGVVLSADKKYDEAVKSWEKGIEVDPAYPSSYFKLASVFTQSSERIWVIFYGETFMNLERNSKRTPTMSKMLFDTYNESIILSDTSAKVDFTSSVLSASDLTGSKKSILPFRMMYGMDFIVGMGIYQISGKPGFNISYLYRCREFFLDRWFKEKRDKEFPNHLLAYQKKIKDNGHFEAYNYWLFMMGDEKEFDEWHQKNENKFKAFAEWYNANPMIIDKLNYFMRTQYD